MVDKKLINMGSCSCISVYLHKEFKKQSFRLSGEIYKYNFKKRCWKLKEFFLKADEFGYFSTEGNFKCNKTYMNSELKIISELPWLLEVNIECKNSEGCIQLWRLKFMTKDDLTKWVKAIKLSKRPRWEKVSSVYCRECGVNFSFFLRQHHCRNCGRVICYHHSRKMPLDQLEYLEPVRVCVSCFDQTQIGHERSYSF